MGGAAPISPSTQAIAGTGIVHAVRGLAAPACWTAARSSPVLEPWWQRFSGPFLYYPGRRLVPAPLRAFIDFIEERRTRPARESARNHRATKR